MTQWQRFQLGQVATIGSGAGFPLEYQGNTDCEFPFLKVSDMNLDGNKRSIQSWNNTISETVRSKLRAVAFPAGSVIFPKIGAAVATNKKRLLIRSCCADNNVMAVAPNHELLEPEFLYFLFLTKNLSDFASDANPPSIRKSVVEEWPIQVPPLDEQRSIVDILSRAEGIVRLRREAQKKAAEIIPALFVDMFGDPATNPKRWPVSLLANYVSISSVVRSPDLSRDADVICMGADSIESKTGMLLYCPTVREVSPKSGKYWFDSGDVLYSKIRPYLAKATLATQSGYCSADMYPLRCKEALDARFFLSLLLSYAFTEFATAESVRARMPKLNRETLFGYRFPLPPITLQKRFAMLAEQCESILKQQTSALERIEATFNSLLEHSFACDVPHGGTNEVSHGHRKVHHEFSV